MINKTAIIIISHNSKLITDNLCENIMHYTRSPYDLIVVETGSEFREISSYTTIWLSDGIRMTRGFNLGIQYALIQEAGQVEKYWQYDSFWLLVNDSKLWSDDTLSPMLEFMRNNSDCGEIHPYIENSPSKVLHKKDNGAARKESFCEIVCPVFSRKAIDLGLLDNRFFYGWGTDFEIPYLLHKNNLRLYISNEVGVIHDAGTTTKSGKDEVFKTMTEQFDVSRKNMLESLELKYGKSWAKIIYDAISDDVSKEAYTDWVVHVGQNAKIEDLKK